MEYLLLTLQPKTETITRKDTKTRTIPKKKPKIKKEKRL